MLRIVSALALLSPFAVAQEMTVLDPGRSGIPGHLIGPVAHAPNGDVWVGARWAFWGTGGIGAFDPATEEWTVLSSETGELPSPFVNDIEFETDGTAWVATNAGLVRIAPDLSVTVWNSANSPMQSDAVNDLSLASDGHVWLNCSSASTGGDAVYDFDGVNGWVRHAVGTEIPFALPWTALEQVFADSQGRVWVANQTLTGVALLENGTWSLLGAGVDRFDSMAEDGLGNIWFGTNLVGSGNSFYRFDGQSLKHYGWNSMTTLVSDPKDGAVYVANWHGTVLRSFDGGESFQTFVTGLGIIVSVAPDPVGDEVWIATVGAVGRFDGSGAWIEDFNTWNTGMPDHFVNHFDADSRGNFWLASSEAGLSRFDGRVWRNWGSHNVGSEPYPWVGNETMSTAFEDSQGRFWFGGNGIGRWNEATSQFEGFWNWQNNPGMGVGQMTAFAEDANGTIFATTEYGTPFRFDEQAQLWLVEAIQPYAPNGLPGMESDSNGNVWIAAWFDLHRWNGNAWSKLTLPYANYLFDKGGVNDFAIGPDDTLYLGTGKGLVIYDGSFQFYAPGTSPLPAPLITGVDVREDGLIGLCARGSSASAASTVCLIDGDPSDPASWTIYFYGSSPLPHWQLGECQFDPRGDLWASTVSEGVAIVHCGAWTDVGFDLEGALGEPYLKGYGVPAGGATGGFEVSRLPVGAPGLHVVGTSALMLPLLGGMLVPDIGVTIAYVADVAGTAGVEFVWPTSFGSGNSLWIQSWTLDLAALQLVSASNAVVVTVP